MNENYTTSGIRLIQIDGNWIAPDAIVSIVPARPEDVHCPISFIKLMSGTHVQIAMDPNSVVEKVIELTNASLAEGALL